MVWLKFLICVIIILFAGSKLARYGDIIAEKTGLGRVWIGMVLIALITSMPELATGLSSAALVKLPNLALGNFYGSCLFNLVILAILDIMHRRSPVLSGASRSHIAAAGIGILLMTLTAGIIFAGEGFSRLALGWVGIPSIIIVILYLLGARQMFLSQKKQQSVEPEDDLDRAEYGEMSSRAVYVRFTLVALAIIGTGMWLSFVGDELANTYSWDVSFVGSLFLAISTSLPELAVTIAAVRLGAIDMAIGDILGANMLNMVAVTWSDIFYIEAPILTVVSRVHITTAILASVMSLIIILGLRFRQQRKTFVFISWYGPLLIGLYIFGAYNLFTSAIG